MKKIVSRIAMFVALVVLASCTRTCGTKRKDMTPEQVVEAYLDISLNMKDPSERERLVELTTGNLKSAIQQATDETLTEAFIQRRYKIEAYSVVERRDRTPRETEITFSLTYSDLGKGETQAQEAPKVTTENTVAVVRENKRWVMRDVIGKKTTIDFPVVAADVIKPGGGTPDESPEPAPAP